MKRSLLILFILVSFLVPSGALAGSQLVPTASIARQGSAAMTASRLREANLVSRQLANGLEVIVLEDHSVPLVTIELAVRNGSYTEPPELNGLSHLYEHMFFKANRAIANAEEYLRRIGQMGIAYNGSTREEVVMLFGMNQAWNRGQKEVTIQLTDRIVISPYAAKRLSTLLGGVVKEYETRFGTLNIEAGVAQAK